MKSIPSLDDPDSHRLLEQHKPLVEKIAKKMVRSLSSNIECDDLIQDGMMGLIDAILRNSKTTTGAQFETYVAQRARGAMLDGLRASDPATRQIRREMRQVELVILQLGHQLGRAPQEGEVAAALGMPLADYQRLLQEAHGYSLISIEDLGGGEDPEGFLAQCADSSCDPLQALERASLRQALAIAVNALPKPDRQLLELYYVHSLKMHEVGKILALSESRISQLHTQAIAQLRAAFATDGEPAAILKPRRKPRLAA
jgi:RNA polymerase sigma factor for flagellar operon FliA